MATKKDTAKPKAKKAATPKSDSKGAPKPKAADKGGAKASAALYSSVVALTSANHSDMKLARKPDYGFASGLSSIVLGLSEFPAAAMHYPIVFAKQGHDLLPFVVTGYAPGENQFVDGKGNWREDVYLPAFVRRYPFILMASPDGKEYSLCVDQDSSLVGTKSGEAIFDEGEPSAAAKRAITFCKSFQDEMDRTAKLCKQIEDADILNDRSAQLTLPDGSKSTVTGFKLVDEQKLNALDEKTFVELRDSGVLSMIYCHLLSTRVWKNLLAG